MKEIWDRSRLVIVATLRRIPDTELASGGYVIRNMVFGVARIFKSDGLVPIGSVVVVRFYGGTTFVAGVTYVTERSHPILTLSEEVLLFLEPYAGNDTFRLASHPGGLVRLAATSDGFLSLANIDHRLSEFEGRQAVTREELLALVQQFEGLR